MLQIADKTRLIIKEALAHETTEHKMTEVHQGNIGALMLSPAVLQLTPSLVDIVHFPQGIRRLKHKRSSSMAGQVLYPSHHLVYINGLEGG